MKSISANDLKTKGISAAYEAFEDGAEEAIITVRGQAKFILIPADAYNEYREMKLLLAIEDAKKSIEAGDVVEETAAEHIKRLSQ